MAMDSFSFIEIKMLSKVSTLLLLLLFWLFSFFLFSLLLLLAILKTICNTSTMEDRVLRMAVTDAPSFLLAKRVSHVGQIKAYDEIIRMKN